MDIVSHGLWAAAGATFLRQGYGGQKGAQKTSPLRLRGIKLRWAFFWGMFPDLFAFTIPFAMLLWSIVSGQRALSDWPRPDRGEPPADDHWAGLELATMLYQYSHSVIIFAAVVIIVFAIARWRKTHFPMEMLGWPLHILIDIPTHTYRFFPTPVFWPISQWRFDGFSWASPEFMVVNYGLLLLVFMLLWRRPKTVIPAREPESRNDRGPRMTKI